MLSVLIAVALGGQPTALPPATKTCPDNSVVLQSDTCLVYPDHRKLYSIYPLRSTITAEWICRIDEKPSRVVLTVTDVGAGVRNSTYKSELTDLAPGNGTLAPDLNAQIAAAIGELTTVPDVRGKCLGQSPVLIIEGFTLQGTSSVGRAFEFKLK